MASMEVMSSAGHFGSVNFVAFTGVLKDIGLGLSWDLGGFDLGFRVFKGLHLKP